MEFSRKATLNGILMGLALSVVGIAGLVTYDDGPIWIQAISLVAAVPGIMMLVVSVMGFVSTLRR